MVNQALILRLCSGSQVRGIKGVFLANQKTDGKVTTLITYNKGRDWEHLTPPSNDMNGKPITCKAVCRLTRDLLALNFLSYVGGNILISI